MTTALDIVTGALLNINSYAPGETPRAPIANIGLAALNELLDSWSTEHLTVFHSIENVFDFQPGKASYSCGPGGDFDMPRPLRITRAYTRISASGSGGMDFPCGVEAQAVYAAIGLKGQPGPWPRLVYMNADYPLATLLFWPVPTGSGEFHMWTDMEFAAFPNLTTDVNLPQGYVRALKKNLALELAPTFGKTPSQLLMRQAEQAKKAVKSLNSTPANPSSFDPSMVRSTSNDAGWILHGGFST